MGEAEAAGLEQAVHLSGIEPSWRRDTSGVLVALPWRGIDEGAPAVRCRDFPRQALHAWRLTFTHPATGEPMTFEGPLPADLRGTR